MLNVFYYVRKHTSLSRHFDSWFIFYFNLGRFPYSEYTQSTVVGHLISYYEIRNSQKSIAACISFLIFKFTPNSANCSKFKQGIFPNELNFTENAS